MKKSHGFTLIEVLLVVLLIGIVSGIVLLAASPNDSSRLVASETERLAQALSLAIDEAVSENQQLGLMLDEKGYRFFVFRVVNNTCSVNIFYLLIKEFF